MDPGQVIRPLPEGTEPVRARAGRPASWRLAVAAVLLWLLFRQVPWGQFWLAWRDLSLPAVLASSGLTILSMVVSAWKWRLVLEEPGLATPGTARLFRLYLVGLFFNNFLPSGMGGDVVRVAQVSREVGVARAAASVVAERLLAAVGLVVPSLVFFLPYRQQLGALSAVVPLLAVAVAALVGLCFFPGWARGLLRFSRRWPRVAEALSGFLEILGRYRERPRRLAVVILWSIVFQGLVVLINFVLLRGLGVPVSLGACMTVIPLTSALAMVPLSINGLGLREWSYVALLAPFGVDAATAVAASLSFFVVVTLVSLIGGACYLLER
ncbi:MAG: flippase-like domain-containing protein [Clostridia bacterium]|nr:MAG: flippase-like domain-containing protein [Clostridia bacterium]